MLTRDALDEPDLIEQLLDRAMISDAVALAVQHSPEGGRALAWAVHEILGWLTVWQLRRQQGRLDAHSAGLLASFEAGRVLTLMAPGVTVAFSRNRLPDTAIVVLDLELHCD